MKSILKRPAVTSAFTIALLVLFSGCQSTTTTTAPTFKRHTITTVSKTSSYFKPRSSDVFIWQGDIEEPNASQDAPATPQTALIQQELNQQLSNKGYHIASDREHGNYYLQGIVTYSHQAHNDNLQQRYGIDAGLGSDSNTQQRGSLLLIISNPSGKTAWRGEVEIYLEPKQDAELRKQRLKAALQSMLASLPAAL